MREEVRSGGGFDGNGRLNFWTLVGFVHGAATSSRAWPDFSVGFCGFCGPAFQKHFIYTTPRSTESGIFQGSLTSFTVTQEGQPAPVPEPISVVLAGTGLAGILARQRRLRERSER